MKAQLKLYSDSCMGMFFTACLLVYALNAAGQPERIPAGSDTDSRGVISRNNYFEVAEVPGLVNMESSMRAGLLYDVNAQKIVWQKDMHYAYPIASLTKMMVALLVVEDVLNCRADWSDEVLMTRTLVKRVKRKKVKYAVTETYSLDALLRLAMIASHNEACICIAKHLAPSLSEFVARMNTRARELGMNNTYFSNPNGLPAGKSDLDNSSSPHDLLLLSLELLKYPEIMSITRIGYAEVAGSRSSGIYRNHNRLVLDFENEVDGLKTGFTRNAKYCLAASGVKDNQRLISIVLGARSTYERNDIVASMMNNYYQYKGVGILGAATNTTQQTVSVADSSTGATSQTDPIVFKSVWTTDKKMHTVRSGENLSAIASRYKCSVSSLKKWNHLRNSTIHKGQQLAIHVPVKRYVAVKEDMIQPGDSEEDSAEEAPQQKPTVQPSSPKSDKKQSATPEIVIHTVQQGDTLWKIAQRYQGVTVEQIKKLNNIRDSKGLKVGARLKIILNS